MNNKETKYKLKDDVEIKFDEPLGKWRISSTGGFVKLSDELLNVIFEPVESLLEGETDAS